MKILALEFSSQKRSVAVGEKDDNGPVRPLGSADETAFRGVTGLTLIDRALTNARVGPGEISLIAIGLGPGSYTGIRSAIAIAQGWQLGHAVKVAGISSAVCLAEQARLDGISGEVTLVFDAQKREVYIQTFLLSPKSVEIVQPLQIIPINAIPLSGALIGPEALKWRSQGMNMSPSAETLLALATVELAVPAERLEPVYLRETSFVKAPPPRHIP